MIGMTEAITIALITGGMSLLGVIITSMVTARKSEHNLKISQAVTDTKIQELTREVREHNGFAKRLPVIEEQIRQLVEKQKEQDRMIRELQDI